MEHGDRSGRVFLWVIGVSWAAVLVALIAFCASLRGDPVAVPYSQFLHRVQDGTIRAVTLDGDLARWTGPAPAHGEFVSRVPQAHPGYLPLLTARGVAITVAPRRDPTGPWLYPLILAAAAMFLMMGIRENSAAGGRAAAFRSSAGRRHDPEPAMLVTFEDVAGVDEAKEELEEIIEFLRRPKKFQALGARIPRGVLLVGPPGSGKTLLAKAIAGEAGVPFFSVSGSEFVEMFVGVGASRVRDLFDRAKKSAPCLLFVDEIDAVGRRRGAGVGGGHDEREQTLNQLLVEMDGFDPNAGIIVIAATNRPDILDPALLRPGRFDRRIVVDNPDAKGRRAILDVHVRGKPVSQDVTLDALARCTPGFSGADLANVVNEAALLAVRHRKQQIDRAEFDEAIERVIAGPQRKSRVLSPREREVTAYHEAGHALLATLLPQADPPHKVTILPRGMALGCTLPVPHEDRYTRTQSELLAELTVLLGGRAAEEIVFGEITTGAANDFEKTSALARRMVTVFGMSETLGPLALGTGHGQRFLGRDFVERRYYSEEIAYEIDKEVRRIIDECHGRAHHVLAEHTDELARIAEALLERETLDAGELDLVLAGDRASI